MKKHDPNSKREKWLLLLLPSVAVLVVYAFLIALPKQKQLGDLSVSYQVTMDQAVSRRTADQSRQNLFVATDGLDRLRRRLAADRLSMKRTSQNWRDAETRLATIQQLTEMLDQYQLSMLNQGYETEPGISTYFRNLTEKINSESPVAPPFQFWKIEVEGKYSDIQDFLTGIDMGLMKTFPITLSMSLPENGSGKPIWTILFIV